VCVAGDDSFDASCVGEAAEVVQEVVCDDELILVKGWVVLLHCTVSCLWYQYIASVHVVLWVTRLWCSAVFLSRRALASIIQGRERVFWNW